MLRVTVREDGHVALPEIDIDDAAFVIGSAASARVRLPASAARPAHVQVTGGNWRMGVESGAIGDGIELAIGRYRVAIAPAPAGVAATPPQRTESLARELLRGMMGDAGAPVVEALAGPVAGARRTLAPPESVLVLGRGEDASWSIADPLLSRRHAEIRRGWDGIRVVDLDSASGVTVNGQAVRDAVLADGALIVVGGTRLRFHDPAHPAVVAQTARVAEIAGVAAPAAGSPWLFYAAVVVLSAALAGIVWLLAT
jgi:hypothetical protein